MKRVWLFALALAVGGVVGCGGGDGPKQVSLDQVRKTELAELGDVLKTLAAEGKKPPGKLAELGEVEPLLPGAAPAIRNGDIVYFWGAGHSAKGSAVIAHEKKAPSEGGWVLIENGEVKSMSAAEFGAAPKAKK